MVVKNSECSKHGFLEEKYIRIKNRSIGKTDITCRLCDREKTAKHRALNKDKVNADQRRIYATRAEHERERSKVKYRKFKKRAMEGYIRNAYGLQADEYWKMVENQNNKCKICGNEETRKQTSRADEPEKICRLTIDHCHETKKVRGLLCHRCNVGIGGLRHDPQLMQKAIDYINQ